MTHVPIRAVVGRFSVDFANRDFAKRALELALQKHPFAFCAHISGGASFQPFAGIPAEHQEWFSSSQVRNAIYAGVNWNDIAPLDEELIVRMSGCESVFMSLVSRLEWKRQIPYLTRRLWYLRHLQFWNDYLTRHRINLYISAWIPHEIPDIVIYHLCKLRGIPVLYFNTTELRDVSFAEHDIQKSAEQILPCYRELLARYAGSDPDAIPLSEPFGSYERALLPSRGKAPDIEDFPLRTYWDHLRTLLKRNPFTAARHGIRFLSPSGWRRALRAAKRWMTVRDWERFYAAHAVAPDFSRPFVYFPLHFQPEATTVPMGGVFADLILAARLLSATLPDDVLIYVKEHPFRSSWVSRSVDYYRDFLELPKVRFIPTSVDTFELREHCRAVATVTGSAGFEAIFRGKPVLLFGSRYYQFARGVFPIRSAADCREAMHAVFERKEVPTRLESHLFMKALEETCIRGVLDPWSLQITRLSEDDHARAMGEAIATELEKLLPQVANVQAE